MTGRTLADEASTATTALPATSTNTVAVTTNETVLWLEDYNAALKQAKELNRPILADFSGSDWCPSCISLDKEVLSKEAFQTYAKDHLVLLNVDFPVAKKQSEAIQAQNEKLSDQYAIEGYPTVLLIDATGKEIARSDRGDAIGFVTNIKDVLEKKPAVSPK